MRVFAAPFRSDASRASVVVGIELVGRDLPLGSNGSVEISYVAIDSKGAEHEWRTDRLSLNAEPATRTRVEQSGVRVLKRMDLPPGRYRLHVAAHETVRDRSGSLIYDLEVPDLDEPRVALSGVVLLSRSAAAMVTAHADDRIKDMLPGQPTALRAFLQDDELAAFAEVYDEGGVRPQSGRHRDHRPIRRRRRRLREGGGSRPAICRMCRAPRGARPFGFRSPT